MKYYRNYIENLPITKEEKEKLLEKVKREEENKVPFIMNTYHLSNILGIKWNDFKKIINNSNKMYYDFSISKKSGGKRIISMPDKELLIIQKKIQEKILNNIIIHENAYGFVKNKSIKDNAKIHLNKDMILNIDLKDFFPSIHMGRVYYIFSNLCQYDNDTSYCLTKLTTYKNCLPQGAPTSPIISNIVSFMLDTRLSKIAEHFNINYTRYADDITFSGRKENINESLLKIVTNIIEECGFKINDKKTRFASYAGRQEVTGLIVNNTEINVSKNYVRKIRQELYYIKKYGLRSHRNKVGFKNRYYKDHLLGKILFVKQINYQKGEKLLEDFLTINWE